MVKRKSETDQRQEVDFTRLVTNYENHSKQDETHFSDIKERLDRIETKPDAWTIKVATIGGGAGILTTIVVLLITKIMG